jgi:hypothetical protein
MIESRSVEDRASGGTHAFVAALRVRPLQRCSKKSLHGIELIGWIALRRRFHFLIKTEIGLHERSKARPSACEHAELGT